MKSTLQLYPKLHSALGLAWKVENNGQFWAYQRRRFIADRSEVGFLKQRDLCNTLTSETLKNDNFSFLVPAQERHFGREKRQ
jgi:hypothetical protein